MKKMTFLCSLPRAGNTFLGSLINQNSSVSMTANSLVAEILWKIDLLGTSEIAKNFPDGRSLVNSMESAFTGYYRDWDAEFIIERGPWGTPNNLALLDMIVADPKFIVLVRPVLECLASFIRVEKDTFPSEQDIENRCHELMGEEGILGKSIWSIENVTSSRMQDCLLINYDDLVADPQDTLEKIGRHIGVPDLSADASKLTQFSVNGVEYDDTETGRGSPLHHIRTDGLPVDTYEVSDFLPAAILDYYSGKDCVNWHTLQN